MRCGTWVMGTVLGCWVVVSAGGCVSLDSYNKLHAQNRTLKARKAAVEQELFDVRNSTESIRTRLAAMEREVGTKDALVDNLRGENELLDEMRQMALKELDGMAGKMGDITISGPKLPKDLDDALTQFANQYPSEVEYDPARGSVKWKADLVFALGSDVVKQSSKAGLRSFSDVIKSDAANGFEVIVAGHTDSQPIVRPSTKQKHPTNWHLSSHRAISVASELLKNGYDSKRMAVMGCGEFRPIADNKTQGGRSQNRRVEIYLVPKGAIVQVAGANGLVNGSALAHASR